MHSFLIFDFFLRQLFLKFVRRCFGRLDGSIRALRKRRFRNKTRAVTIFQIRVGDGGGDDGRIFPGHPSPILHAPRDITSRKGKSLTPMLVLTVGSRSDPSGDSDDDGCDDGRIFPEHPSPTLHAPRDIISRKGKSFTAIYIQRRSESFWNFKVWVQSYLTTCCRKFVCGCGAVSVYA